MKVCYYKINRHDELYALSREITIPSQMNIFNQWECTVSAKSTIKFVYDIGNWIRTYNFWLIWDKHDTSVSPVLSVVLISISEILKSLKDLDPD